MSISGARQVVTVRNIVDCFCPVLHSVINSQAFTEAGPLRQLSDFCKRSVYIPSGYISILEIMSIICATSHVLNVPRYSPF